MRVLYVIAFVGSIGVAQAQQTQPNTNKIIDNLINQRNSALNAQVLCEANLGDANDKIASFQAELDKLKPKKDEPKPEKK